MSPLCCETAQEIPLKQVTIAGMEDDESISTLGIPMRLKPPSMLPCAFPLDRSAHLLDSVEILNPN